MQNLCAWCNVVEIKQVKAFEHFNSADEFPIDLTIISSIQVKAFGYINYVTVKTVEAFGYINYITPYRQ